MNTALLALVIYLGYLALAFGLRTWLLYRRTGTTGYRGLSGPVGSAGWWGGIGFIIALLAGLAAPTLQLLGAIEPFGALDSTVVHTIGLVLTLIGAALTLIRSTRWADTGESASTRTRPPDSCAPASSPSSVTPSSPPCSSPPPDSRCSHPTCSPSQP